MVESRRIVTYHVVFGISAGAIISCILLFSPYLDTESSVMLVIFNFLFVSLLFPLHGMLLKKLCLLLVGNVVGVVWNYVFSAFANDASGYFGESFQAVYVILNPFLNLIWIVSFWSLSLATISVPRRTGRFKA